MSSLKIKAEFLPTRCEICHQADCFDPLKNYCSRCDGIALLVAKARTNAMAPTQVPRFNTGIGHYAGDLNRSHLSMIFESFRSVLASVHPLLPEHIGLGLFGTITAFVSLNLTFPNFLMSFLLWLLLTLFAIVRISSLRGMATPSEGENPPKLLNGLKRFCWKWISFSTTLGLSIFLGLLGYRLSFAPTLAKRVEMGDTKAVQGLLKLGVNPNLQYKLSPLRLAIFGRHSDTLQALIKGGANVNERNETGYTPLMYAADHDNSTAVKLLLEAGADTNVHDQDGWTPLLLATGVQLSKGKPYSETARLLLAAGARADQKDYNGHSALMYAAEKGDSATVKALLERGADVNAKDDRGWTALILAERLPQIMHQPFDTAKILLEHGANPNTPDQSYQTPLMYACMCVEKDDLNPVMDLLEKGAEINAVNQNQETALKFAAARDSMNLIRLLFDKGANIRLGGNQALSLAAQKGNLDMVRLLLDRGADVNYPDDGPDYIPLMSAIKADDRDIVELLLGRGAQVNLIDESGNTLLINAVCKGSVEMVKALVDKGESVNAKGNENRTALMYAVRNGEVEMVKLLIKHGAHINDRDKDGDTVSKYLKFSIENRFEIYQLLTKAGAHLESDVTGYFVTSQKSDMPIKKEPKTITSGN